MYENTVPARNEFIRIFKEAIVSELIEGLEQEQGWRRTQVVPDTEKNFTAVICKGKPPDLFSMKIELLSSWQINGGSYQVGVRLYRGDTKLIFLEFCLSAHYGQQPEAGDISKLKLFLESCKKIACA